MKITITNREGLVPFSSLGIGKVWITRQANLDVVNTMYVKTGATSYVRLGGGFTYDNVKTEDLVRPITIKEVVATLDN